MTPLRLSPSPQTSKHSYLNFEAHYQSSLRSGLYRIFESCLKTEHNLLEMSLFSIPILAFTALSLLALYKFIIYPTLLSPLSSIPNAHWSSPVSSLWSLWIKYKVRENRVVHAAHLKHGSVVRLGPNELSVNDVGGLRTVYAGGFEKGEWYSIFDNYG